MDLKLAIFLIFVLNTIRVDCQSCPAGARGYFVNPTNCQKYYFCDNGVMYSYDCATASAGWAKEFYCSNDAVTKGIVGSVKVKSIPNPNGSFKNLCTTEGWLADSENCNRYFKCYRDAGQLKQLKMDVTGMCQTSEFAKNCNRQNSIATPNTPQLCANRVNGWYPHPTNCNKYFYCNQNQDYVYDCTTPSPGFAWDFFCSSTADKQKIMSAPVVRSIRLPSGLYKNQCTSEGWLADSANCLLYFRCYLNNGQLSQTKFDITEICDSSDYIKNCKRNVAVPTTVTTPTVTTPTVTTPTPKPVVDATCDTKADGFYPNPTDCTKAFQCAAKKKTDFTCADTTTPAWTAVSDFFCKSADTVKTVKYSATIDCATEGYFADPKDCTKFYKCGPAKAKTLIDVTDQGTPKCGGAFTDECKKQPPPAPTCDTKADGYYYLPSDCTKVYQCLNKVKTDFSCTDTTTAGWKDVADFFCKPDDTVKTVTFVKVPVDCATDGYFADTTDCTKFYKCATKVKTLLDLTDPTCGVAYPKECAAKK